MFDTDKRLERRITDAVLQTYIQEEKITGKKLTDREKEIISVSIKAAIRVVQEYEKDRDAHL